MFQVRVLRVKLNWGFLVERVMLLWNPSAWSIGDQVLLSLSMVSDFDNKIYDNIVNSLLWSNDDFVRKCEMTMLIWINELFL